MNKLRLFVILISISLLSSCLKEMKEKEITISVKEDDPIKILQSLTRETQKTEVMILGCPHLKTLENNVEKKSFDSLISLLNNFSPDQIGIQTLTPNFIRNLSLVSGSNSLIMNDDINNALEIGLLTHKKLKVSYDDANKIVDSLISELYLPKKANGEVLREKLILYQIASFDLYSAVLQWSYLSTDSRKNSVIIPKEIKDKLEQTLNSYNEITIIALRLAAQKRLQKLIPIDDQQDKDIYSKILPSLMQEIANDSLYLKISNSEVYKKTDELLKESVKKKNLINYFKYINSREYAIQDAEAQWGVFYKLNLESGLDRTRAALWEVRNLNIASNVRRATTLKPGSKMLVIVDPSHKPFLEAYLSSLGDIKIIQLNNFDY